MTLSHEQLLTAVFEAYYDARRNKRNTASQLRFEMNLEENLVALTEELESGRYRVGRSVCFIVTKPVKREVFAADFRDRVVHHLLFNWLSPLFERTFIDDCYSCRKGKGTLYGIRRVAQHLRRCSQNYTRPAYVLKTDIRGYFMSINRQKLLRMLFATLDRFAPRQSCHAGKRWDEAIDYALVKGLLEKVVMNDPTEGCLVKGQRSDWNDLPADKSLFTTPKDCGLPIGNLTSQLFSNIYLAEFDHWVKRDCRQRHYGRYVDDIVVVGRSRRVLARLMRCMENRLRGMFGLVLHPHKRILQPASYGLNVLGMRLRRGTVLPGKRVAHNLRMVVFAYIVAMVARPFLATARRFFSRLNSYFGMLRHCASLRLREWAGLQLCAVHPPLLLAVDSGKKVTLFSLFNF